MKTMFSSLRYFNYRIWFCSALVANVGTWMQRIAQDWLVMVVLTQNSGLAVGVTTALQFGPALIVSPWAGLLADRLPRRKLLMVTQGLSGLLAMGLGALVLSGNVQLWQVFVFAGLLGTVSAFDNPVRQTFVGQLVPPSKLSNAVGLNSASFNAARLIGPAIAGVLIAIVGTGWIFIINGVSFGATIIALACMRTRELQDMPKAERGKGQIREGMAYVRRRTDIIVILVVMGVVSAFGLNFAVTSAMMARVEFGKGPGEYGLLGSIMAIGSLAGALLAARRERPRVRLVLGAAFAFSVCLGISALMPTYTLYAVACIPLGLASLTMMTAANSTIQMSVEPEVRGRVMSLYMVVFLGATPLGSPLIGWVCEVAGPRWGIGVGAIASGVVTALAAWWALRNWNITVAYQPTRPYLVIEHPEPTANATGSTPSIPGAARSADQPEAEQQHQAEQQPETEQEPEAEQEPETEQDQTEQEPETGQESAQRSGDQRPGTERPHRTATRCLG